LGRTLAVKIVVIAVLLVMVWLGYRKIAQGGQEPQYQTAKVEEGTIVASISASGTILTANRLPITTSATGIIKKVYAKDGDTVSKGQKIAEVELDSDGAQRNASAYSSYINAVNSLTSAQNNYRSAQASAEKVLDEVKGHDTDETLVQKETRTKAEVARDNAYNSIKSAELSLSSAALEYRTNSPIITAPYAGVINNITIVEGMTLSSTTSADSQSSGQRIAVIDSKGTPLASFNVSEVDVSQVSQGQKATIKLDSLADKTFTGKIVSVDKIGTVASGVTSYPVVIKFDIEAPDVLTNMAATANIILETKDNVLLVPSSAIQTQGTQSVARVIRDKRQVTVVVETGLVSDTQTEILSGLSEGDEVVTSTTTSQTVEQQGRSVFGGGSFGGGDRVFIRR